MTKEIVLLGHHLMPLGEYIKAAANGKEFPVFPEHVAMYGEDHLKYIRSQAAEIAKTPEAYRFRIADERGDPEELICGNCRNREMCYAADLSGFYRVIQQANPGITFDEEEMELARGSVKKRKDYLRSIDKEAADECGVHVGETYTARDVFPILNKKQGPDQRAA